MTEFELDAMMQTEEIEPEDAIEKKGFMFMKSYLESYEILKKGDSEELANQLLKAIVYYGGKTRGTRGGLSGRKYNGIYQKNDR
jgi:hypothetical protein